MAVKFDQSFLVVFFLVVFVLAASPGAESACNIVQGKYRYTDDLMALEATASGQGPAPFLPATPLRVDAWQKYLAKHPDQRFAQYTIRGIREGFHIGVDRESFRIQSQTICRNLPSVTHNRLIVAQHIRKKALAFRLRGPLPQSVAPLCHIGSMGLIPKSNQPGKWRLTVDLSSPAGASVNEAITPHLCSLRYVSL